MVGRIFVILVIISSGASYYFFAPNYFTPKTKSSVTILLDDSLFAAKYPPKKVATTPPPPMKPTLEAKAPKSVMPKSSVESEPTPPPLPPVIAPIKTISKESKTLKSKAPPVAKAPPVPTKKNLRVVSPLVPVNSYGNDIVIPLKSWEQATIIAGNVDQVLIDGSEPRDIGNRPLNNDDVLQISGWAGNMSLGMRMRYVLISMCKEVIGHTPILDRRPDIAETIHPNLVLSGWTAWIAVAHLPRCEDPRIRFWAMGAHAATISPLVNRHKINLPASSFEPKRAFYTDGNPLKPERLTKPIPVVLNILNDQVNLHHCADADCRIIGTQAKGSYLAFIADTAHDWALIQFRQSSGWLAKSQFEIEKK
jgi:hypothetical protein